jgi:hypothetical protein
VASLLAVYRAPSGELPAFLNDLGAVLPTLSSNTLIVGDLNIDLNYENDLDNNSLNFETLLTTFGFYNTLSSPTRYGSSKNSSIDHIITNIIDCKIFSCTVNAQISDHVPVVASFNILRERPLESARLIQKRVIYSKLKLKLESCKWQEVLNSRSVNECFEMFTCIIKKALTTAQESIKTNGTTSDKFHKNWMNSRLFKLISKRSRLHKQCKPQPCNQNLKKRYQHFRNYVTNEISKAKTTYFSNEYKNCKNNMNDKWKFLNKILNRNAQNVCSPTMLVENVHKITDPTMIAECLNNHFVNIGEQLASQLEAPQIHYTTFLNKNILPDDLPMFEFTQIEELELLSVLEALTLRKATGYDQITVRTLKENKLLLVPILAPLINKVISQSSFPDCLKVARVTPLFKKGSRSDPNNYRPISILPTISKVIEKLMERQMRDFILKNGLISRNQYGFQKEKNTTSAISHLLETLYTNYNSSEITHGVFLYFSKAFDTVNHSILINKLQHYRFSESARLLVESYLTNRKQFVKTDVEAMSSQKAVNIGVPQGSILGPLLFLIFINDLTNCTPSIDCILFADDTNIFSTDIQQLQNDLNNIDQWCLANRLILNSSKTLHVMFKDPKKYIDPNSKLKINENFLSIQEHTKFLGVILDSNISFKKHIQHLNRKLNVTLLIMRHVRRFLDDKTMIDIYYTFFYPHLIYGIEFWGHGSTGDLNKILVLQKKALRIILCAKPNTTISSNFATLKIMPVQMLFKYRLLIHFTTIFTRDEIVNMKLSHKHDTRLKASNAIKMKAFKTNKGQRSMLFSATKLFNEYLYDYENIAPGTVRERLVARLWGLGSSSCGVMNDG